MRALLLVALVLSGQEAGPSGNPRSGTVLLPVNRWAADMRSKNLGDILSMYTPYAVFIQPNGTTIRGREALRTLYQQVFATYDSDLLFGGGGFTVDAASSSADQSGDYTETLRTRATGHTQILCGHYSFTWHHQPDGQWLLSRQQWSAPAPCGARKL